MSNENPVSTNGPTRFSAPAVIALVLVAALFGALATLAVQQVDARTDFAADRETESTEQAAPEAWQAEPVEDPFETLLTDEWNPFQEMQAMRERMDKLFNDSWMRLQRSPLRNFSTPGTRLTTAPSIDVTEQDTDYVVRVDMPGLEDGQANVTLQEGQLSISGSRVDVIEDTEGGHVLRQERRATHFARTLPLPGPVDPEGMTTRYDNGVLTIRIPKLTAEHDSTGESNTL